MPAHPAPATILSRHHTSEGMVVYARGVDGDLQVWLEPSDGAAALVAASAATRPDPAAAERVLLRAG